jgi:hypothetical protein
MVVALATLLAACGLSGSSTATNQPTSTSSTPLTFDRSSCSLVTPAQVAQAVGEPVTTVGSTTPAPVAGLTTLIQCFYSESTSRPHAFILLGTGSQPQASFATLKQQVGSASPGGATDASGLGDAAFTAAPTGAQANEVVYTLFVRKGQMVLEFATDLSTAAIAYSADKHLAEAILPKL